MYLFQYILSYVIPDLKYYGFFIFLSFLVYKSYEPMKLLLNNNDKFRNYNIEKQNYIIKNFIKSIVMSIIFIFMIFIFIPNLFKNKWNDSHNRLVGAFYVSNDLAGLIAVKNLPLSTKVHHYTTVFLYTIICIISTEEEENIGRLIVVYTIFSCIPFLVNSYLGLRFFYTREKIKNENDRKINKIIDLNRILAFYIYIVCCILNWSYHIIFLLNIIKLGGFSFTYLVYYGLLYPIINDDIILLTWLKENKLDL
tara:strand:+ start:75 stop:833 length:759 start_codon:yes stop_codon:yes gene_type:complete